jgi:hypothetical protein
LLARSEGFEPPALGIEIRCSIQLSYERLWFARLSDLAGQGQQRTLIAGVPAAVLADIGGRALAAVIGRGAVVIGKDAGLGTGPVIVEVADLVGQWPMIAVLMAVMPGIRQTRGQGGRAKESGEREKLHFGHLDSPQIPLKPSQSADLGSI